MSSTLADLLSKTDHEDEAIKILEDMLKRHADNEQVVTVVRQTLSVIYVNRGDYGKGEAQLELLLARNPDDPLPNNDLGYLYAEQGKNLEKAELMIRKALQEEPDTLRLSRQPGLGLVQAGQGQGSSGAAQEGRRADEIGCRARGDRRTTPRSSSIWATCTSSSSNSVWRVIPGGRRPKAAAQAVPPDKRLPEIRKKIESLEKLGPMPKPAADRTP